MILNGNTLIEILPLKDMYTTYKTHRRLTVFVNKGCECVVCGRTGVLLLKTLDKAGGKHVDLYTDDFILMTVDHIVPKKNARQMGWKKSQIEDLLNKQTMCSPCNNYKGHKDITIEEQRSLLTSKPQRKTGDEIIRELVFNEGIFNRSLQGVA